LANDPQVTNLRYGRQESLRYGGTGEDAPEAKTILHLSASEPNLIDLISGGCLDSADAFKGTQRSRKPIAATSATGSGHIR
jgi:hypothetical protein